MTNGDKFRNMTDYKLAEAMCEYCDCMFCPVKNEYCSKNRGTCVDTWAAYFAKEIEEANADSFRFPGMLYFSQRLMLEHAFENWCRANGAATTPMNMVAFLQDKQLIKIEDTHLYLKDKQGLKTDDWKKVGF